MRLTTDDPDEMGSGVVYSSSSLSVYVPEHVEMPANEAVNQARQLYSPPPEGVIPLEQLESVLRDHPERAHLLALIDDTVGGGLTAELTDVNRSEPEAARIPIRVAAEGKPLIAAYLAVHGLSNTEIAGLLDIGSRTVSQYISDLKAGDR